MTTHSETIRGFERPASLGGKTPKAANSLVVRWFGTTSFELCFRDRVILLDNFYDRGPRTSDVGFRAADVTRADLILVGHPHYDHIGDTADVASRTSARVIVSQLGADLLVDQGLSAARIEAVSGLGNGDEFEFDGFSVRVLHGLHMRREGPVVTMLKDLRPEWDDDLGPLTVEEQRELEATFARGSLDPEVFTKGTLCHIIEIDGYRIVFRDSAGPISPEEVRWFANNGGCDLALVAYTGRPVARRTIKEMTLPLIECYQPRTVVPCHHDDLFPHFLAMPTEPLRMAVRDQFGGTCETLQPMYVEPIELDLSSRTLRPSG
jgi:L-ascorbate metabolism protein UlaG (beta-lactamase superfamily)